MENPITHQEYVEARKRVERFRSLKLLQNNSDFKKLIIEGYLTEYPLMLAKDLKNTDSGSVEESRVLSSLKSVALFEGFLQNMESTIQSDIDLIDMYETSN